MENKGKLILTFMNTKKYHVFAPMGRFQLEFIYLIINIINIEGVTSTPTRPV